MESASLSPLFTVHVEHCRHSGALSKCVNPERNSESHAVMLKLSLLGFLKEEKVFDFKPQTQCTELWRTLLETRFPEILK